MRLTTDFKSLLRFGLVILGVITVIVVNVLYSLDASRGQRTPDSTSTPLAQHDVCLVPANGSSEATGYQGSIAYSYDGHLHILNLETREVQTFTGVRAMVAPDWYPYGRLLALGRGEIHILDSRSGEILTLTNSPDTVWDPSWSPDGRRLVYMQMSGERGLYILDIFSRERTKLNIGLWNPVHPAWSPDGKQIAFGASDETGLIQIYVVDLDTCSDSSECESTQLTNDSRGQSFEPAWSPEGRQIAFTSYRDGFFAIYTMSADGSDQRRLTNNVLWDTEPTWSPDGNYIAFVRWGERDTGKGISNKIYVIRPDGTDLQCILGDNGTNPDWWMELDEVPDEPIELLATESSS